MKCYLSHDMENLQTNVIWSKTPGKWNDCFSENVNLNQTRFIALLRVSLHGENVSLQNLRLPYMYIQYEKSHTN